MRSGWLYGILATGLMAGVVACSSGSGNSASSAAPATSAAPSSAAPAATSAAASPASSASSAGSALPDYKPSKVISQAGGHTQLSSTASVSTVTAFYEKALKSGGWTIISTAKTSTSANFVAKRGTHGVTVAISSAGPAGTSISVSTYKT